MRRLVAWLRRRRHADTTARIRALEVELGYAQPSFVEAHANPDLLDWRSTRRSRRERARWEAQRDAARRYGGQHSPWGVARPPLVNVQGETPPPSVYMPGER